MVFNINILHLNEHICCISESVLSEELKELQIPIQIIEESYKQKWASTALKERFLFYESNDFAQIFETFPNLANATGYNLVCNYYFIFTASINPYKYFNKFVETIYFKYKC